MPKPKCQARQCEWCAYNATVYAGSMYEKQTFCARTLKHLPMWYFIIDNLQF